MAARAMRAIDPVKLWSARLTAAGKAYDEWASEFDTKRLIRYYIGQHWRGVPETDARKKYIINLVFANVETQLPSLLFAGPVVKVEARPDPATGDLPADAEARANVIEGLLQQLIDDPRLRFVTETQLALRDAYWQYALCEVGYSADWLENPHADRPVLRDDGSALHDGAGQAILQPKRIFRPGSERIFVKRLDPSGLRVSPGRPVLLDNDWVAYGEWHHLDDVRSNPLYTTTDRLKAGGQLRYGGSLEDPHESEMTRSSRAGMVHLWRIWDLRTGLRHVLADTHPTMLQEDVPFAFLPLDLLKFFEIPNQFLPLPPLANWLSPQDELNETREMQRVHRRRFVRRYMREPSVSGTEWDKLETGEDGVCIEVPKVEPTPIKPIPDADLSAQNWTHLAVTHTDYNQIAGVASEARGAPNAPTATQANIINVRAQVREGSQRQKVAAWLASLARLLLLTARDRLQGSLSVRRDGGMQRVERAHLADLDVDVSIDLGSLSPVAQEAQRLQWNQILALLTQPPLLTLLMETPPEAGGHPSVLLRKTLALHGITAEHEVREIWRVGQAALNRLQLQALMGAGGGRSAGVPSPPALAGAAPGVPASGPGTVS